MNSNDIFIVPDGGLANRFRSMVSGIYIAKQTGRNAVIVWHKDNLCNADLSDILRVSDIPAQIIEPNELVYRLVYDMPRKRNFFLPKFVAPCRFEQTYYDGINLFQYLEDCMALHHLVKQAKGDVLFFSGQEFYDFPNEFFQQVIHPSAKVVKREQEIVKDHIYPEYAFHIRRTDHKQAIEQSPLQLFLNTMNNIGNEKFFCATDDDIVKQEVCRKFPHQVIFNETPATRSTREGIIDAMAEIMIMSKVRLIYGSAGSSFTEAANKLGDNQLTRIIKTDTH